MHTRLIADRDITYDGRQLAPHWIYRQLDLMGDTDRPVTRKGDDLYLPRADGSPGKLSVSIATASATSTLIHTGFNIETEGTPVPTIGLSELGVDSVAFGQELLRRYANEVEDIWMARCTVTTGGTSTCERCATHSGVTEVQPGSFIFLDRAYRDALGDRGGYANALTVLATVISQPAEGRAVVDAGLKALATDLGNPEPVGLPGVRYRPAAAARPGSPRRHPTSPPTTLR